MLAQRRKARIALDPCRVVEAWKAEDLVETFERGGILSKPGMNLREQVQIKRTLGSVLVDRQQFRSSPAMTKRVAGPAEPGVGKAEGRLNLVIVRAAAPPLLQASRSRAISIRRLTCAAHGIVNLRFRDRGRKAEIGRHP